MPSPSKAENNYFDADDHSDAGPDVIIIDHELVWSFNRMKDFLASMT